MNSKRKFLLGVSAGFVVPLVCTSICVMILSIWHMENNLPSGFSDEEYYSSINTSFVMQFTSTLISSVFSYLGAYLAARIALRHAFSCITVVIFLTVAFEKTLEFYVPELRYGRLLWLDFVQYGVYVFVCFFATVYVLKKYSLKN